MSALAAGWCAPVAEPDLGEHAAAELAVVVKALADPTRLRIVDVLRKAAPEALCQCELRPLFDMSQPALAKHLKVLRRCRHPRDRAARPWTYYYVLPDGLEESSMAELSRRSARRSASATPPRLAPPRPAALVRCGARSATDQAGPRSSAASLRLGRRRRRAERAVNASLGCGVPTAVADLHEGETVLDLGSGAGADVLISARRVGPTGKAIGLDMTDEMLELARANAADGRRRRTSSSSRATSRTSRSPTQRSTSSSPTA